MDKSEVDTIITNKKNKLKEYSDDYNKGFYDAIDFVYDVLIMIDQSKGR